MSSPRPHMKRLSCLEMTRMTEPSVSFCLGDPAAILNTGMMTPELRDLIDRLTTAAIAEVLMEREFRALLPDADEITRTGRYNSQNAFRPDRPVDVSRRSINAKILFRRFPARPFSRHPLQWTTTTGDTPAATRGTFAAPRVRPPPS